MELKNLKLKSISAIRWATLEKIAVQIVNFVIGILLARVISPEEFGTVAMITVFTGILMVFRDFGIGSALIQQKEIDDMDCHTMFWTNIAIGVILTILVILNASLIASFYKNLELYSLTILFSITFFINSFTFVHETLFRKNLDFKVLFYANFFSMLISGLISLGLAYLDFGVISLIWRGILNVIFMNVFLWFNSSYRPKFKYSLDRLKVLLNYSIPLLGSQLINYFTRNGDNLIVGRYLGSFQLGIYSRGYQFVLVPVKNMTGVISKVMFSSLSVIGDNLELVQKTYLKMIRLVSTITIPIILGVFFLADSFVYIILGENWKEVIIVIKTMTFVGAVQSVGVLVGVIFNSQNKNKLMFNLNIISALFFFGMVIFGVQYGITGLLNSVLFSSLVIHIPQAYFALRTISLSLKDYFWALFPIIISTIVSFIIMHLLKSYIVDKIGITTTFHLLNLILSIPIMLMLTLFFLRIFNNKDFIDVKNMIQKDLLRV